MTTFKQPSVKLPLLIAAPVLLVIGVAAVFLLQPDGGPTPQPNVPEPLATNDAPRPDDGGDPLVDPDPRPRPEPKPGAPTEIAVADAMKAEVDRAFNEVRARLELKYKGADYTLDRSWTLEQVVRRLDKLTGTHFNATDYALTFPQADDALAEITCATVQGRELPDGPLTMSLNLRTGETTRTGTIFARNADGYVLLDARQYREISDMLRRAAVAHILDQAQAASGLAGFMHMEARGDFDATDFSAEAAKSGFGAEFACRSVRGAPLAEPAVISVDYKARTVTLSRVTAPGWMELDEERDRFTRRAQWLMQVVANHALGQAGLKVAKADIQLEAAPDSDWGWRYASFTPFDVTIVEYSAERVVLEVASCFGRALPFGKVRYVAEPATGTYKFED
jgi:hypothetical protein